MSFSTRMTFGPLALALALSTAACGRSVAVETPVAVPAPTTDEAKTGATSEKAVLAGGCFWGVQGVFQHVKGVTQAISGYAGGSAAAAHYENVGTGMTGHAESVQVTFDPRVISYGEILRIYFSVAHDPTEKDRQGPDVGTQYRSTIFPQDASQQKIAEAYIAQLNTAKTFGEPLATTVEPGKAFYRAEDYHQDFLAHNPSYPYIAINDLPKIDHLKQMFPDRFSVEPVLTSAAVAVSVR